MEARSGGLDTCAQHRGSPRLYHLVKTYIEVNFGLSAEQAQRAADRLATATKKTADTIQLVASSDEIIITDEEQLPKSLADAVDAHVRAMFPGARKAAAARRVLAGVSPAAAPPQPASGPAACHARIA